LPALEIRSARASDVETLALLLEQLGYPADPPEIRARLEGLRDDSRVIVAATERGLLGFVAVEIAPDFIVGKRATILGLVVADGSRSEGIGAALLAAAETWAFEREAALVSVRSNVIRDGAHRFYERQGYRRIKSQHVFEKRKPLTL
jgi:ribosomal protein S18 acetylase RimI-like enzyme